MRMQRTAENRRPRAGDDELIAGEPGPIRLGSIGAPPALDDAQDPIVFPSQPSLEPLSLSEAPLDLQARPRRRGSLIRGLVLGCVLGAAAGGLAALILDSRGLVLWLHPHRLATSPAPATAPIPVPAPDGTQIITDPPRPDTALVLRPAASAPATPVTAPATKASQLDLERLASSLAKPPSPAPSPSPLAPTPQRAVSAPAAQATAPPPLPPAPIVIESMRSPSSGSPLSAPAVAAVAPASPECASARSRADQLVCRSPDLALADRRLNQAYDRAMATTTDRDDLHFDQQRWLQSREGLAGDRQAMLTYYQERIGALTEQSRRHRRPSGLGRLLRQF